MVTVMDSSAQNSSKRQLLMVRVGKQKFAINVFDISDVLVQGKVTKIPLVSNKVLGVLNLRGRIVTSLNLYRMLEIDEHVKPHHKMSVVIERQKHLYSLTVDEIYDVKTISESGISDNPGNLSNVISDVSSGVLAFDNDLVVIINTDKLLDLL